MWIDDVDPKENVFDEGTNVNPPRVETPVEDWEMEEHCVLHCPSTVDALCAAQVLRNIDKRSWPVAVDSDVYYVVR